MEMEGPVKRIGNGFKPAKALIRGMPLSLLLVLLVPRRNLLLKPVSIGVNGPCNTALITHQRRSLQTGTFLIIDVTTHVYLGLEPPMVRRTTRLRTFQSAFGIS